MASELSVSDICNKIKMKLDLPDWIMECIKKELNELVETGSDDRKLNEAKKFETDILKSAYIKGPKIGNGAFGEVFKGIDIKTKNEVAIKVIDLEETSDDLDTIRREIRAMSEGRCCQQMTRYYGSEVVGTNLHIIMEYLGGGSVADLIKDAPLEEPAIAVIIREVAKSLEYLANENKLHRDIKAANILLSSDGLVKLADFGSSATLTETVNKRNTMVDWMAPEILLGTDYDKLVDIWSLGITCIELAKQKPPNSHLPPLRVLQMIPTQPAPRLKGEFSDEFKDFVSVCLKKETNERANVKDLLIHPFIMNAGNTKETISPLLTKKDQLL